MIKYKYIGGWSEKGTFFTEGNEYEVKYKDKKGNIELEDNNYNEYGQGLMIAKCELNEYFEEVAI